MPANPAGGAASSDEVVCGRGRRGGGVAPRPRRRIRCIRCGRLCIIRRSSCAALEPSPLFLIRIGGVGDGGGVPTVLYEENNGGAGTGAGEGDGGSNNGGISSSA